jgi:hypothetical protein
MRPDNANDRTFDDDFETSLGASAQAFALTARRDPDVRALDGFCHGKDMMANKRQYN